MSLYVFHLSYIQLKHKSLLSVKAAIILTFHTGHKHNQKQKYFSRLLKKPGKPSKLVWVEEYLSDIKHTSPKSTFFNVWMVMKGCKIKLFSQRNVCVCVYNIYNIYTHRFRTYTVYMLPQALSLEININLLFLQKLFWDNAPNY